MTVFRIILGFLAAIAFAVMLPACTPVKGIEAPDSTRAVCMTDISDAPPNDLATALILREYRESWPEIPRYVVDHLASLHAWNFSAQGNRRPAGPPYHLASLIDCGAIAGPGLLSMLADDSPTPFRYVDEQFQFYPCGYGMNLSNVAPVERTATLGDLADYALRQIYGIQDVGYRSYSSRQEQANAIAEWRRVVGPVPPENSIRD
jgi:hypothetical protein